jgi:RNA polymerase sigma-70 factor (ECF subfamily)
LTRQLHREQIGQRVATEVARLPLRQRTVLALCYYEGFSNAEAAAILDTTTGAVEALLVRARRKLQERLTPLTIP